MENVFHRSEEKIQLTPSTVSRDIISSMPGDNCLFNDMYMRFGGQDLESESDLSDFT